MAFLESLAVAVAPSIFGGLFGRRSAPKPPRDPLQEQLIAEQLAQMQMWKSLAPLLSSQQTLAGISQAREALDSMLRQAAAQQAALGLVDSEALERTRGSALAQFGEAVARLRQQQPMLLAQLLQGAQTPMQALQQIAAQRQAQQLALEEQARAEQQALGQAFGQAFGFVFPELLKGIPKPRRQPTSSTYPWNPNTSLRLGGPSYAPMGWEDRVKGMLRW